MAIINQDKWMHQGWWKMLGVLIMLYVLIGGMITPLKPGIESYVGPNSVKPGDQFKLSVVGYNTNFKSANEHFVALKIDSVHYIKADNFIVVDDQKMEASFQIPKERLQLFGLAPATLLIHNEKDGFSILPSAVNIKFDSTVVSDTIPSAAQYLPSLPDLDFSNKFGFPYRSILNETIRNTFFHVALWLSMVILLLAGLYHAIRYLRSNNMRDDSLSAAYTSIAIIYGLLGLVTGSVWAKYTWGTWWTTDVKLNMSAVAMLIYLAYFILRNSNNDFEKRARVSAVYAIFSFVALLPLIFVIPRMYDSLHPGNGGNPALGGEDLDNTLRMFFYPSIIAFILLGVWIATLWYRSDKLEDKLYSK